MFNYLYERKYYICDCQGFFEGWWGAGSAPPTPPPPPPLGFNSHFRAKYRVIFGQNHLILGKTMKNKIGQLTSAPLKETGPAGLYFDLIVNIKVRTGTPSQIGVDMRPYTCT